MIELLNTTTADSGLSLAYAFHPTPNPIRASPPNGNLTLVTLQVIVSNPGTEPVTLKLASIAFPLGQDIDAKLSGDPKLPDPSLETPGKWQVALSPDGTAVHIKPASGSTTIVFSGKPLIFVIRNIRVNRVAGQPTLTITETSGSDKVTAEIRLEKLPYDFPVSAFSAEPGALYKPGETVKLKWAVTDTGKNRSYRLRVYTSETGKTYTWQEGKEGVTSSRLNETTIFLLDVFRAEGHEVLDRTLQTIVTVDAVSLSPTYNCSESPSGRYVKLGWFAKNAATCTVMVDDIVVDDDAPTDTMADEDGYCLLLSGDNGTRPKIQIVAMGLAKTRASLSITTTTQLGSGVAVPGSGGGQMGLSKAFMTPDGQTAFLMCGFLLFGGGPTIAVDMAHPTTPAVSIPIRASCDMAITAKGDLALVVGENAISYLDIANRRVTKTVTFPTDPEGHYPPAIAITPDGKTALVYSQGAAHLFDVARGQFGQGIVIPGQEVEFPLPRSSVIIFPNGHTAAVSKGGMLFIADLPGAPGSSRLLTSSQFHIIDMAMDVGCMAITPDQKYLVACGHLGNQEYRIKIVEPDSGAIVYTGVAPGFRVSLTPDSRFALCGNESRLLVLDLARRTQRELPIRNGFAVAASQNPALIWGVQSATIL